MKYKVPMILMILACAFGIILIMSNIPPALAANQVQKQMGPVSLDVLSVGVSQANQIKILIGIIAILFTGYMWWLQKYISTNDEKHRKAAERSEEIANAGHVTAELLKEIVGEHRMSIKLKNCGANPNELRDILEEILSPLRLRTEPREVKYPEKINGGKHG